MLDHVGVTVSDLAASVRFYRTVLSTLGAEPTHVDAGLVEWEDWAIGPPDAQHLPARGVHVGFRAVDHDAVRAFWQAGIDAGYRDGGAPGPRTIYGPDYYGAFLLDPDGNSAEAVYDAVTQPVLSGRIDHLWLRVGDPQASRRFYEAIAPHAGLRLFHDTQDRVGFRGTDADYTVSFVRDEHPRSEHLHVAWAAGDDAVVRDFHAAAVAAGYEDNGPPGERSVYHPGYYGAFVLDPDGHNIEVVHHNE